MAAKPIKTLELHYTMIQVLIILVIQQAIKHDIKPKEKKHKPYKGLALDLWFTNTVSLFGMILFSETINLNNYSIHGFMIHNCN